MKRIFSPSLVLCILTIILFVSCQKELSGDMITGNLAPFAKAGIDQKIVFPIDSVRLDGSASTDPDGNITEYLWTKISGPSSNLINASSAATTVKNLRAGTYQFELHVKDNGGLSARDTIMIMVVVCDNRQVINATLVPLGILSSARIELVSAAAGNKILFAGGSIPGAYSSRVDIYDITTNTWSTSELSIPERSGMAVASVGNKIFFAGGGDNDWVDVTSRIDIYDATSNSWSTAELSQPRNYLSAVTVGDQIFFAGGKFWGSPGGTPNYEIGSDVVDIYNNTTNSWRTARLSEGRYELSATAAEGKIYFAGGLKDIFTGSNRIDVLDISTNTWTMSQLQEIKASHASIESNKKIFWASGAKTSYQSGYTASNVVEIRNITTGVSSFECIAPKTGFDAVIKNNNLIFFTGRQESNVFDIYNSTTNTWSIGLLPVNIHQSTIISVNNTVYVAGGIVNGSYSKQVWKLEF